MGRNPFDLILKGLICIMAGRRGTAWRYPLGDSVSRINGRIL
jgi:hypothetical protein